jgi:hypothetical protein
VALDVAREKARGAKAIGTTGRELEVVIFHHFFQFIGEGCFIEQIANAQTATSDFIK